MAGTLQAARAALAKRPKDGALRFVVARAEAMSGDPRGAVRRLEALLADEPTNFAVARVIAQILAQIGPREDAIQAFERVLSMKEFITPEVLREAEQKLLEFRSAAGH